MPSGQPTRQHLLATVEQWISWATPSLADVGIVTLADQNYFPGLLLLHRSAQASQPTPVACFDLGLTDVQRSMAAKLENLSILPLPECPLIVRIQSEMSSAPKLAKTHKRVWPLWICPALIASAPFRRVYWMDSDVVILRNLAELFVLIDEGPVFTPENNAPEATPNKLSLYEYLPIERDFDPRKPAVNAGVSGWDLQRDREVLAAYTYPIIAAVNDERVRDAISWHDQGALIWAIQRCGMEHRVLDTWRWNLCVRNSVVSKTQIPWGDDFLERVRALEPAANILHWNGTKVPWTV